MVSGTISLPSSGCFSPFPHGTGPLSVSYPIFSLAGWSRRIHTGFHVPRATQDATALRETSGTEPSSSMARLSRRFPSIPNMGKTWSYYPGRAPKDTVRFGLFPGRSPLLGESLLFSLPGGTKMFQFPPFASMPLGMDDRPSGGRVVPFGYPRVKGHLHLTADFRSLSRPSSPP